MRLFFIVLYASLVIVKYVQCQGATRTGRYVYPHIDAASLLTPVDMCSDPVHTGPSVELHEGRNNMNSFHYNLIHTTETVKALLRNELRKFRRKHVRCSSHEDFLNQLDITDFVHIDNITSETSPTTQIFRKISLATNLLSILDSQGARDCCYSNSGVYFKVRNRVQGQWYIFNQHRGIRPEDNDCILNARPSDDVIMTCDAVRDFIYVILRHCTRVLEEAREFAHQLYCRPIEC